MNERIMYGLWVLGTYLSAMLLLAGLGMVMLPGVLTTAGWALTWAAGMCVAHAALTCPHLRR